MATDKGANALVDRSAVSLAASGFPLNVAARRPCPRRQRERCVFFWRPACTRRQLRGSLIGTGQSISVALSCVQVRREVRSNGPASHFAQPVELQRNCAPESAKAIAKEVRTKWQNLLPYLSPNDIPVRKVRTQAAPYCSNGARHSLSPTRKAQPQTSGALHTHTGKTAQGQAQYAKGRRGD